MSTDEQAARGLAELESYLCQETHLGAARLRVAAFLAQSAGLSHRQKRDIEEWYLDEQKYVAATVTQHIADSIARADSARHRSFLRWMRWLLTGVTALALLTFVGTALLVSAHP